MRPSITTDFYRWDFPEDDLIARMQAHVDAIDQSPASDEHKQRIKAELLDFPRQPANALTLMTNGNPTTV